MAARSRIGFGERRLRFVSARDQPFAEAIMHQGQWTIRRCWTDGPSAQTRWDKAYRLLVEDAPARPSCNRGDDPRQRPQESHHADRSGLWARVDPASARQPID